MRRPIYSCLQKFFKAVHTALLPKKNYTLCKYSLHLYTLTMSDASSFNCCKSKPQSQVFEYQDNYALAKEKMKER